MLAQSPTLTILIEGFGAQARPNSLGLRSHRRVLCVRAWLLDTLEEVHSIDVDGRGYIQVVDMSDRTRARPRLGVYPHPYDEVQFDDLRALRAQGRGQSHRASCAWDPDASIVRSRPRTPPAWTPTSSVHMTLTASAPLSG